MADQKQNNTAAKPAAKKAGKKKRKLSSPNGVAHIHSTLNNTIVTITDQAGNAIA